MVQLIICDSAVDQTDESMAQFPLIYWYIYHGGHSTIHHGRLYWNMLIYIKADTRFAPSQWETVLLCNDVSAVAGR